MPISAFSPKEQYHVVDLELDGELAVEIKRIIRGVSPDEAIASFARLWVADPHWQAHSQAAERVMNRTAGPRSAAGGAT
jgi:enoyl-CoA hydratase